MIHGRITSVGVLTQTLVTSATGKVAHSFDSTLYLKTEQGLFCIAAAHLPRGPLNLNCTVKRFDPVPVGTQWEIRNHQIAIGNIYTLSLQGSNHWSPKLPQYKPEHVAGRLAIIRRILAETHQTDLGVLSVAVDAQLERGENALTQWLANTSQPLADESLKLLGTGMGLTPAGDDYLSGVLVTLHYVQRKAELETLRQWVEDNAPGRTNDISLALLAASCTGIAIEPVHELLCDLMAPGVNTTIKQKCQAIVSIGHNSGRYILRGILAVLESTDAKQT